MTFDLTTEQQFQLTVLEREIKDLDEEQTKEYLIKILQQMMRKDNLMKQLLKTDNSS